MGSPDLDRTRAIAFLRRDVFRNVVMLKNLTLYADHFHTLYCDDKGETGVLQILETQAPPRDYASYPQTKYVVLTSLSHPIILGLESLVTMEHWLHKN